MNRQLNIQIAEMTMSGCLIPLLLDWQPVPMLTSLASPEDGVVLTLLLYLPPEINLPPEEEQGPQRKKAQNNDVSGEKEEANHLADKKLMKKKKKNVLEKIKLMVELDRQKDKEKQTNAARIFVSRYLEPTMECLNNQFAGDVKVFADTYQNYQHTTWKAV